MTTPSRLLSDVDEQPYAWEAPLTRLLLLLEIASEPDWLRELAVATGDSPGRTGEWPSEGAREPAGERAVLWDGLRE
ncbi:hypothetical protein LHJ74_25340 [Streptomyces sp. N2-109]|uniref:Uncharacterized protein n=1 Tax=Streptomyces gossypii TaxID=2883101 RepID=A0ABT2JZ65_9ACTN|nr:hypothetical protein [Streptomyces gossypii]MCT2593190.1 hypothetical protein [Streptomyces gossypii]